MVILFSNSLCYDTMTELNLFGEEFGCKLCMHPFGCPFHPPFAKWTEKAAAAALQERINAEQGLPALWRAQKQWINRSPGTYGTYETYVISLGTVRFSVLVILQSRPNTPRSAAGEDDEVPIGEVNTDELIKLLTRLGTFRCPGHQELATQCKKRNPGGSMVFSRFLGSPETASRILLRTPLDRSLMTVASEAKQCGVASTLIEQVGLDGVIGVLFWGEAVGT